MFFFRKSMKHVTRNRLLSGNMFRVFKRLYMCRCVNSPVMNETLLRFQSDESHQLTSPVFHTGNEDKV